MDPATGMIIGGAIGAGGSLIGSALGLNSQKSMFKASQEWQERMANTAHQREVADLRAAGLNPILSANKGAPMPGAVGVPNMKPDVDLSGLSKSISSAAEYKLSKMRYDNEVRLANSEVARRQSEIALNEAAMQTKQSETVLNGKMLERMDAQIGLDLENTKLSSANARMVGARTAEQEFWARLFKLADQVAAKVQGGLTGGDIIDRLKKELGDSFRLDFKEGAADIKKQVTDWFREKFPSFSTDSVYKSLSDVFSNGGGNGYGGSNSAADVNRKRFGDTFRR